MLIIKSYLRYKCNCVYSYLCLFTVWYLLLFSILCNSLINNLISSWENSAFVCFAAAIISHYKLAFSFYQVPITAGWTEASRYERLAWHLSTWPAVWLEHRSCIQVPTAFDIAFAYIQWSDGIWLPLGHVDHSHICCIIKYITYYMCWCDFYFQSISIYTLLACDP